MSNPVLIIECGRGKLDYAAPLYDLYTGTLWKVYRKAREDYEGPDWRERNQGRHPNLSVFVLSAELGLTPGHYSAEPYNRMLVPDTYTGPNPKPDGTWVMRVSWLVSRLDLQRYFHSAGDKGSVVHFVGGKLYRQALEEAGFDVRPLAPKSRGSGDHARALKLFLAKHAPNEPSGGKIDLDALLHRMGLQ